MENDETFRAMGEKEDSPKKNMFDLLGYVEEEFEEIKVSIEVMSKELVEIGIEDYLKAAGRGLSLEEKDFLVAGVLLGEQIQQLLEERK